MRLWSLHPKYLDTRGIVAVWREGPLEEEFPLGRVKIQGIHNVENMMAAIAAAKAAGIEREVIQQVLETFPGLEHRLEFVRERNGVRYFNDSKGTNVGAVVKSLASFSGPVILLAGGVDKGGDYEILTEGIRQKVRRLVLFGAAKEIMAKESSTHGRPAAGGLSDSARLRRGRRTWGLDHRRRRCRPTRSSRGRRR